MGRGPKPTKGKAEPAVPLTSRKNGAAVRDLEKRLAEAQEQQKATSEILRAISGSLTDVQPVLDIIALNAARVCGARDGAVLLKDEADLCVASHHGPLGFAMHNRQTRIPIGRDWVSGRSVLEKRAIQVEDLLAVGDEYPRGLEMARIDGHRTTLATPLLREGEPIGVLLVRRGDVRLFTPKQMELLQTFADQAVIAIENVRLFKEREARNNQLSEALDQQTATSEVLKVISRSTFDLDPVLNVLTENATRLSGARNGALARFDGERFTVAAVYGSDREALEILRRSAIPLTRGTLVGRVGLERRTVHILDILTDAEYEWHAWREKGEARTVLGVPMLRGDVLLGVLAFWRYQVQPFTDKQVELVKTFADQAVIAIENVRLFKELEARNRDVTEALDQKTATSEILRVIASSPTNIQPVFDTIVKSVARLCDGMFATLHRFDGELLHWVAQHNYTAEGLEAMREAYPMRADRDTASGRAVIDRTVIHVRDFEGDPDVPPRSRTIARAFGYRSLVTVPMLREGQPVGAIAVARRDSPFSAGQITLLQTFADQAVIAIENVRLFNETKEALEQQTATSEILRVISSSPTDIQPVFDAIARSAAVLCGSSTAAVFSLEGGVIDLVAHHSGTPEWLAFVRKIFPADARERPVAGWVALERTTLHFADIENDPRATPGFRAAARAVGFRRGLLVPMHRAETPLGAIAVGHAEPGAFSDRQIALLKTFADQAVIAIENVRLFKELELANRELEAASQHKSEFLANMSHELRTPLNAIIGFSEVLSEKMFGELNEKQEEYSKDIHASGQHLLSLINDILDLSKIEAGRMELELTDFDLPTALDSALTLVRERAGRRGIALQINVDERLGQIQADERKVRQVVLNLLSNAIKFTPEGGRIEVGAVTKDGVVEVSVSDTGVGIAPEDQEAVFEEFRQVGTADKKVEGTGLGLALSRKFVELHGGRIWVTSQLGVGSTFTFALPLTIDHRHQTWHDAG